MTESFPHSGWAEAYYAPVYYHALKRCGNVWDAADVTQSTFVKALIHGGDLRNRRLWAPGSIASVTMSWASCTADGTGNRRPVPYRRNAFSRSLQKERKIPPPENCAS